MLTCRPVPKNILKHLLKINTFNQHHLDEFEKSGLSDYRTINIHWAMLVYYNIEYIHINKTKLDFELDLCLFQAEITITLNNVSQKMILRGSGVDNSYEANRESEYFPSEDEINQMNPPAMFFSTSHIDIGPLKPKTISKEVFFVNNNSTDIFSFMFFRHVIHFATIISIWKQ